jgi:hypothetical protein
VAVAGSIQATASNGSLWKRAITSRGEAAVDRALVVGAERQADGVEADVAPLPSSEIGKP